MVCLLIENSLLSSPLRSYVPKIHEREPSLDAFDAQIKASILLVAAGVSSKRSKKKTYGQN